MRGFKSFGHKKVTLPISQGLTAIVGPNGSGKSNIVEAFSFVTGQISAKILRAGRLSELIYYGGEGKSGKRPAPYAKVTLYFEDNKGDLPIDTEKVKISRKVGRNGKCTYWINEKRVSRQEIVDLLSGKISEPSGHNISMQGDIDKFITMNPIEKRKIIDDIAGVAEFDEKKRKSLSELEDVRTELRGQKNVLNEIKRQMKELEKERDDALCFRELKDELKRKKSSLLYIQIKSYEDQLRKIREEIGKRDQRIKKLRGRKEKIEARKSRCEAKLSEYEDFIDRKKKSDAISQVNQARARVATLNERINSAESEYDGSERKIRELGKKLEKEIERTKKDRPLKKFERLLSRFRKLRKKFNELARKVVSGKTFHYKEFLPKLNEAIESVGFVIEDIDKTLQNILKSRKKFLGRLKEVEETGKETSKINQIQTKLAEARGRSSSAERRMKELKKHIKSGKKEFQEAKKSTKKIKETIKEAKKKKKSLFDDISKSEDELVDIQTKIENLEKKRNFSAEIATLKTELKHAKEEQEKLGFEVKRRPKKSPERLEGEVRKIKEQIEKLKPINERAIQKYEEEKKRYDSQKKNYDKLESEKQSILDFIEEIDGKKIGVFLETYEEISNNFSEIFSKLSPGGEGKLVLENSKNPLEEGIIIEAKPAGKKLLRDISMSGGEKALTGAAFIFAIQRARPSSFYVLDEIDAHLDPVNKKRAAEMVKQSAGQSQILVVTLMDAMMSVADRLFGVSMDEFDVSHLVSVDLEDLD